jgi:hypothetical protein
MYSTRYFCQILMKLEFSRQIFQKILNQNFMKIRPVGAGMFHADGRTDRQTDAHEEVNSRFSQFCEFAKN